MKKLFKILLIGFITTIFRVIGQLLIPSGEQSILPPSSFVENGTLPMAFSLYGIFVYSCIASMFLLIRNQLIGNNILKGLKYGASCAAIWIIYLFEPLPHVVPIDRITYPLADGLALLVMGLLLGLLFGKTESVVNNKIKTASIANVNSKVKYKSLIPLLFITSCFVAGRLIQYIVLNIYSCFDSKIYETLVWCVLTGFVVAYVMTWLNKYILANSKIKKSLTLGCLLFGINLTLFNFFIPLVFTTDIPDLIIRTVIDFASVTIGCFALKNNS